MEIKKTLMSILLIGLGIFVIFQKELLTNWKVAVICFGFLMLGYSLGINKREKEESEEEEEEEDEE